MRKASFVLLFFVVMAFLVSLPNQAHTQTIRTLLNFEGDVDGAVLRNEYRGVVFISGNDEGVKVLRPPLGTISGVKALKAADCGSEFCGQYVRFKFGTVSHPVKQHYVKLSTGLIQASGAGNLAAVLSGYSDLNGSLLVVKSAPQLLGSTPTAIDTPIEIRSQTSNILSATLTFVFANNPNVTPENFPVVFDNLEYDAPLTPPPPDTTAPAITITKPVYGETVYGNIPGVYYTNIEGEVIEENNKIVEVNLNNRGWVPVGSGWVGTNRGRFLLTVRNDTGLIEGNNQFVVRATDWSNPPNVGTKTHLFVFRV